MPVQSLRVAFSVGDEHGLAPAIEAALESSALSAGQKAALRQAQHAGTYCADDLRALKAYLLVKEELSREDGADHELNPAASTLLVQALRAARARPLLAPAGAHSHGANGEHDSLRASASNFAMVPSPPVSGDEASREAWRASMRARQEHRDYLDLVTDLRAREITQAKAGSFGLLTQQLSVGVNLIVSLLSAVALGYFLGRAWYGAGSAAAWVGAITCGIAMLLLEAFLIVSKLTRVDGATHREAQRDKAAQPPPRLASAPRQAAPAGGGRVSTGQSEGR
jgi:hypothetical protein